MANFLLQMSSLSDFQSYVCVNKFFFFKSYPRLRVPVGHQSQEWVLRKNGSGSRNDSTSLVCQINTKFLFQSTNMRLLLKGLPKFPMRPCGTLFLCTRDLYGQLRDDLLSGTITVRPPGPPPGATPFAPRGADLCPQG